MEAENGRGSHTRELPGTKRGRGRIGTRTPGTGQAPLVVGQFEFWELALQPLIPAIMPAAYPFEYDSLDQSPFIKVFLIWQAVLCPTAYPSE